MRTWLVAAGASLCAMNAPAFGQSAEDVFGDRGYALAMDDRCGLFDTAQRAALEASYLQARGALLRSNYTSGELDAYRHDLDRQVAHEACDGSQANAVKTRVELGFQGYQRLTELDFPGDQFGWSARRPDPTQTAEWLIHQDTDQIQAGLVRDGEAQHFAITLPDMEQFASVILVLRDMVREPSLYDPTVGGLYQAPRNAGWARWTPPDYARRFIWSAGRLDTQALEALTGSETGIGYRFPGAALDEIAARDPRETARIDFLDRRGERVLSHYFEIGDFAAALAFLRAAPEPLSAGASATADNSAY